jgi:ElaB/YqjD/DUF883 family membrane-anchored ribosome-binding protein
MIPSMSSARSSESLEQELEALRRELQQVPPIVEEVGAAAAGATASAAAAASAAAGDARSEVERVLGELQARFADATDEAENVITANPFASVAAAFLLGVLVANVMSRGR